MDEAGEWKLSSAYDLTPSEGINGEHTALVNGKGANITDDDFKAVAERFGIKRIWSLKQKGRLFFKASPMILVKSQSFQKLGSSKNDTAFTETAIFPRSR